MNPTRYYQHQDRTNQRSDDYRPKLRLNYIEIKHQRHPRGDKEEAKIGNQEVGQALHPLQLDPTQL